MSASLFTAVLEAPADTVGVATGDSTWRFAVQMLVASGGARVGKARVGTSRVSDYQWYDLTSDLVGIEWTRGAPLGGQGIPRPNVGVLNMTLENTTNFYSTWNQSASAVQGSLINSATFYAECSPKRLIRVVMFKPTASTSYSTAANGFTTITRTNWAAKFTGWSESWDEEIEIGRNLVRITASETLGALADIDKPAVVAVGSGDELCQRLVRLNADANFTFPMVEGNSPNYFSSLAPNLGSGYTLQATTMAANRLSEVYLSGDSIMDTLIYSDSDGSMRVGYGNNLVHYDLNNGAAASAYAGSILRLASSTVAAPTHDATLFPNMVNGYYAPPLEITNNADFVINSFSMTRVGGTEQTGSTQSSIGQYGVRSHKRTDLIGINDTTALYAGIVLMAEADGVVDPASTAAYATALGWDQTLQPGQVTISDQHEAQRAVVLLDTCILDYYDEGAALPSVRFIGRVLATHDAIIRTSQGIQWATQISVFPRFIYKPTS
ncbi:MAG: hypothetical protein ABL953_04530 [Ilumatobacteraceae bacterium]